MSSGQLGVIPKGLPQNGQIITPLTKHQVQVFRDNSDPHNGTYYGRLGDETNPVINEIIGGPGVSIPLANDTGAVNAVVVSFPTRLKYEVVDGYVFQVRLGHTNTGAVTLTVTEWSLTKPLVDAKLGAITSGNIVLGSVYMITYNQTADKFQVIGLDQLGL